MSLSTKSPQRIWEEILNNDTDTHETPEKIATMFQPQRKVPKPKLHKVKKNPFKPNNLPKLIISDYYRKQTLVTPKSSEEVKQKPK